MGSPSGWNAERDVERPAMPPLFRSSETTLSALGDILVDNSIDADVGLQYVRH